MIVIDHIRYGMSKGVSLIELMGNGSGFVIGSVFARENLDDT